MCPWTRPPLPISEFSLPKVWGGWWAVWSLSVSPEDNLTSPCSGRSVAEAEKAPLQRALQVTVPHFLDRSRRVFQPTR